MAEIGGLAEAQLADRQEKLALSSETDPFGDTYGFIDDLRLTDSGLVTFSQGSSFSLTKIYQGTTAKVTRGIQQGTVAPSGGFFTSFSAYDVNASGQTVFGASPTTVSGLYLASPTGIKNLALKDAAASFHGLRRPGPLCHRGHRESVWRFRVSFGG